MERDGEERGMETYGEGKHGRKDRERDKDGGREREKKGRLREWGGGES